MKKYSAGIILYREKNNRSELLLGHMGGPFWANKEDHAWTIPKGEFDPETEQAENAALREFEEETGTTISQKLHPVKPFTKNGKTHYFFLAQGDISPETLKSDLFEIEWPPKSGKRAQYPELDRFGWFTLEEARGKLVKGQLPALEMIKEILNLSTS